MNSNPERMGFRVERRPQVQGGRHAESDNARSLA